MFLKNGKGHKKVMWRHTKSIKIRRGTHGPPAPKIWCNSDYYLQSYGILLRQK